MEKSVCISNANQVTNEGIDIQSFKCLSHKQDIKYLCIAEQCFNPYCCSDCIISHHEQPHIPEFIKPDEYFNKQGKLCFDKLKNIVNKEQNSIIFNHQTQLNDLQHKVDSFFEAVKSKFMDKLEINRTRVHEELNKFPLEKPDLDNKLSEEVSRINSLINGPNNLHLIKSLKSNVVSIDSELKNSFTDYVSNIIQSGLTSSIDLAFNCLDMITIPRYVSKTVLHDSIPVKNCQNMNEIRLLIDPANPGPVYTYSCTDELTILSKYESLVDLEKGNSTEYFKPCIRGRYAVIRNNFLYHIGQDRTKLVKVSLLDKKEVLSKTLDINAAHLNSSDSGYNRNFFLFSDQFGLFLAYTNKANFSVLKIECLNEATLEPIKSWKISKDLLGRRWDNMFLVENVLYIQERKSSKKTVVAYELVKNKYLQMDVELGLPDVDGFSYYPSLNCLVTSVNRKLLLYKTEVKYY